MASDAQCPVWIEKVCEANARTTAATQHDVNMIMDSINKQFEQLQSAPTA